MVFLFFLLSYLIDLEFCILIFLQNRDSQLLLDNMLSAIYIALQAPDIFRAFFRRPHRCFPPSGLSVLSAALALFRLTKELNQVAGLLLRSGTFNHSPISTFHCQSWAVDSRQELILHAGGGAFTGFDEVNRPRLRLVVVRTDCSVHCIGHRLKYLVVSPTVPPIT